MFSDNYIKGNRLLRPTTQYNIKRNLYKFFIYIHFSIKYTISIHSSYFKYAYFIAVLYFAFAIFTIYFPSYLLLPLYSHSHTTSQIEKHIHIIKCYFITKHQHLKVLYEHLRCDIEI